MSTAKQTINNATVFGEQGRQHNRARPQYKLALKLLSSWGSKGGRVLDLGCGLGEFSYFLDEMGFEVVCVDRVHSFTIALKEKGYEGYTVDLEHERLPFEGSHFDIVFSLEVIEHLWNTDNYLSEIKRVLKTDGYAILTTPNYNCWHYRMQHLLGNFERFTYKSRHKKFYTVKSFRQEIESYFRIEQVAGIAKSPIPSLVLFNDGINSKLLNFFSVHIGILARNR